MYLNTLIINEFDREFEFYYLIRDENGVCFFLYLNRFGYVRPVHQNAHGLQNLNVEATYVAN